MYAGPSRADHLELGTLVRHTVPRGHAAVCETRREMAGKIWSLELVGIPFIVILGSLLHFAFAWSGYWIPVALVAAVNESAWEQLKLAL